MFKCENLKGLMEKCLEFDFKDMGYRYTESKGCPVELLGQ